jgi:hypothetical protein
MKDPFMKKSHLYLAIKGERLSQENAIDLIFRTTNLPAFPAKWAMHSEDLADINEMLGFYRETDPLYTNNKKEWFDHNQKIIEMHGFQVFDLLYNYSIINPHPWCDWHGNINSIFRVYSIPYRLSDITDELDEVAAAFPYLNMTVQAQHQYENNTSNIATAEWRIVAGMCIGPCLPNNAIKAIARKVNEPPYDNDYINFLKSKTFEFMNLKKRII